MGPVNGIASSKEATLRNALQVQPVQDHPDDRRGERVEPQVEQVEAGHQRANGTARTAVKKSASAGRRILPQLAERQQQRHPRQKQGSPA